MPRPVDIESEVAPVDIVAARLQTSLDRSGKGPISPEMRWVQESVSRLASPRGRICENLPWNIIGSLLIAQMVHEFRQQHPDKVKEELPPGVEHAAEILLNVPLFHFNEKTGGYFPVKDPTGKQMRAESVLYKRGCGFNEGVVIAGPLTGLILSPPSSDISSYVPSSTILQQGLSVERLWNDESLRKTHLYSPNIIGLNKDKSGDQAFQFSLELDDLVRNKFEVLVGSAPPHTTIRQLFFQVAKSLGVVIAEDKFQYYEGIADT